MVVAIWWEIIYILDNLEFQVPIFTRVPSLDLIEIEAFESQGSESLFSSLQFRGLLNISHVEIRIVK